MSWIHKQCAICKGERKIEIGKNLKNKSSSISKIEKCPACIGKGWIDIYVPSFNKHHKRSIW